jgi:hypothetical protein
MADDDWPRHITLLRGNSTVMFEDGTPATIDRGVYNHHQQFIDLNKGVPAMTKCAKSWMPSFNMPVALFMGGSEDKGDVLYSSIDGLFDAGFYIGKTDKIVSLEI